MIKSTLKNLANTLFEHRKELFSMEFRDDYDPENDRDGYFWHAEVVRIADAAIALIVYYGGGNSFAYDMTDDNDAQGLYEKLKAHEFDNPLGEEIWIERDNTISVDAMRIEGDSTSEMAEKYVQMMDLLLFISDEFDRGRCSNTEIENKLNQFF